MSKHVVNGRSAPTRPRTRLLLALGLTIAAVACGDDPVRVTDDVIGTWTAVADDGGTEYIRITEADLETFSEDLFGGCFESVPYEILEIDGPSYRITDQVDTFSVELRREDENLRVAAAGSALTYSRTTFDPQTLSLCAVPNPDVACADLPALAADAALEASITAIDSTNGDGTHYDAYRIDVDATTDVALEMRSSEIDSYLYLFADAGALVAQDDDASSRTLDARIEVLLDPGCYVVVATTAGPADFGEYVIELILP